MFRAKLSCCWTRNAFTCTVGTSHWRRCYEVGIRKLSWPAVSSMSGHFRKYKHLFLLWVFNIRFFCSTCYTKSTVAVFNQVYQEQTIGMSNHDVTPGFWPDRDLNRFVFRFYVWDINNGHKKIFLKCNSSHHFGGCYEYPTYPVHRPQSTTRFRGDNLLPVKMADWEKLGEERDWSVERAARSNFCHVSVTPVTPQSEILLPDAETQSK